MSLKYRVRLKSERVIGPFSVEEFAELFSKGHIVGTELCQQFPIGDWEPLSSFPNLYEIIQNLKSQQRKNNENADKEATKTVHTKKGMHEPSGVKKFIEFKFGKDIKLDVNYTELEKKYQAENIIASAPQNNKIEKIEKKEKEITKTVLLRKQPAKAQELDKTVIYSKSKIKLLANSTNDFSNNLDIKKTNTKANVSENENAMLIPPTREELVSEETKIESLTKYLPGINAEVKISEAEWEKQIALEEKHETERLNALREIIVREQAIEDGTLEEDDEKVEFEEEEVEIQTKTGGKSTLVVKKKKKGMSVVAALAFLGAAYYLLWPEEQISEKGPLYIDIKFPITNSVENISAANASLVKARKYYAGGTYLNRSVASGYYLDSLQHQFSGNEALGETVLTYAELLDNTKDKYKSANILYKYIQLSEPKLLIDSATATGVARFFGMIGKNQTGIYTIKNYLRAGNKPTPKMLTYYLDLLIEAGELVEAREVYKALEKISQKPYESYYYLAKFNILDDKEVEAKAILEAGLKIFPSSSLLLLEYARLQLKELQLKNFEETLLKVKKTEAERSPVFLAKFYHYMGYLSALKGKSELAAQFFKKSLAIKESDELRSTLAKLEIGGNEMAQILILESKVLGLLKKAKAEYKNKNIETAFQYTIEAVDANPDFIPAVLFQAKLNADRGYFESTIFSLQRLMSLHNKNSQIKKMLAEVYIKSYKFEEADRLLLEIGQTNYTPDFASLMGDIVTAKKNPLIALKWYDRALKLDPLRDEDLYKMAKILVRNKRFPEARKRLMNALLLDPKNSAYHALYSEILYEQDSTDTAIGYLRDTIAEIGEDSILVSAIATAYFRSGQLKEFQAYYKKIQAMPKKDEGFYKFLMSAAKLEGRKDEYVKYGRELLKLNPGNLDVRMNLGEILHDEKRYDEAIIEFNEIKDKLDSYPQVYYNLARVYLAKDEMVKAKAMAEKELEFNPKLDSAYFIIGEVYRLRKEYNKAIAKYEKAISLNPKSVDALMSMGWIRLSQNYATEAIELFNRALTEEPMNPFLHKKMGDAYYAAGRRALAKEKYEDYLRLNPAAQDKETVESLIRNLK